MCTVQMSMVSLVSDIKEISEEEAHTCAHMFVSTCMYLVHAHACASYLVHTCLMFYANHQTCMHQVCN